MPELPEVEILCRHLSPKLKGRKIREVEIFKPRLIRPNSAGEIREAVKGAAIREIQRRGKFILFKLEGGHGSKPFELVSHLGMTGRMWVQTEADPIPKHAVASMVLDEGVFIFQDPRGFGRFTLDDSAVQKLGPEPLGDEFTTEYLFDALSTSAQPVKPKLLDQTLVAGVGNIYASEALFRATIPPQSPCNKLGRGQVDSLRKSIREVLRKAIGIGERLPLDFALGQGNGVFYHGSAAETKADADRFFVYDREGEPCRRCRAKIVRTIQAGRSTFHCPVCQDTGTR